MQRFEELIDILKRDSIIPKVQVDALEHRPVFDPILSIEPRIWWKDSFDWYVAIEIISGERYGPFYRTDGKDFLLQIGEQSDEFSEKKCFFGLEKPKNYEMRRKSIKCRKIHQWNIFMKSR